VRERARAAGWSQCIVVNQDGVVLGRLGPKALAADADADDAEADVESAMDPGPATIRPETPLEPIVERLRKRDRPTALITTADGRLVGVLHRDEAEQRLAAEG
jgi:Mg/Co/Ni transporter MgtE